MLSQRTKNRFKEHTLVPVEGRVSAQVNGLEGTQSQLYECIDADCTWKGWFPVAETDELQQR